MKFKTIDRHFQESECKQYTLTRCHDPEGLLFYRLWNGKTLVDSRRVKDFREDRELAIEELTEIADNHKANKK